MDNQSFASLAQIRILLVPVGSIPRATFEKWSSDIRKFETLRLGDIPSDTRDDRVRFMPKPLAEGHVHLGFPSHPPPPAHVDLSLFRPSDFPLAVVGIATCTEADSLPSINAQFRASLADVFPANSLFPLATNCFVFEEGDGNLGDAVPGLVVIPSMMGNKEIYVGTLLADLCSQVLAGFATLMQTLESPLGNEYLNKSLFPSIPGSTRQRDSAGVGVPAGRPTVPSRNSTLGTSPNISHGRMLKVLADLFLLAGRTSDASVWYMESIALFKLPQDVPWHAAALEGMATTSLLIAWSKGQGLNNSISNGSEAWNDLSEKLSQATALYSKYTPLSNPERDQSLLTYLYCTAVIRHSTLLFSIWSAKGWGPVAFASMLHPGPGPLIPPALRHSTDSLHHRERMTTITGVSRASISALLSQAHGPWLLHLGPRERIVILTSLASMFSCLEYKRKEAYILREVTGCVMDLLIMARDENSEGRPDMKTPILGYESKPITDSMRDLLGIRASESSDGNESILKLVAYICRVHGVDLDAVKIIDDSKCEASVATSSDPELDDQLDPSIESFGWSELQVGVVREAVAIAEALPDYPTVARFSVSALKFLYPVLSPEDQLHLYNTSTRSLATARRRGMEKKIAYWSWRPIASLELLPLPFPRVATERPLRELALRGGEQQATLAVRTDPFLYNPRRSLQGQVHTVVVQNEPLEFMLTLSNSFAFDLELQDVTLSTSGPRFDCKSVSVTVAANSFHTLSLTGAVLEPGDLIIRGCIARTVGSESREFTLPLSTNEEEDRRLQRRTTLIDDVGRAKYPGLASRPWEKARRRQSAMAVGTGTAATSFRFLQCKVLPQQPLLRIRRTSLTHGAVMLYNGEASTVRLTLENVSDMTVDLLRLTFDDSTITPAQGALDDGNLSVFDTYETEYELIHRPVFSWSGEKDQKEIAPGKKAVVSIICLGKTGCTSGTIQVIYACTKQPQLSQDFLATRRIVYPMLVTVYDMLECHGMDFLSVSRVGSSHNSDKSALAQTKASEVRRILAELSDESGWCLFTLDVRNTYGTPFEVTFERVQKGVSSTTITHIVPPGSTTRIILPVKRIFLPHSITSQPIPILSDRQFVVAKSKLSVDEEQMQRELFWYREEIFKSVKGYWREAEGSRSGNLSLRQQRMSLPMLEALRTEKVRLSMSLMTSGGVDRDPSWTLPVSHGKYKAPAQDFVFLRTSVTNLSTDPLLLTVDITVEPADHVIHDGVLSNIAVGRLDSGETHHFETVLCFLSLGQYEVMATTQRLGIRSADQRQMGQSGLQVVVT